MNKKIKIAIVDDNKTFLEGLVALLENNEQFEIVAVFTSGEDLLKFKFLHKIDVLLLDVEMPGIDGVKTAQLLNYNYPSIKIIAVTMYQEKVYLTQLIESGFKGFVSKTNVSDELFGIIDKIMKGELCFPESIY
jgi:two-component system nitrate/nitrite response regulator NarL